MKPVKLPSLIKCNRIYLRFLDKSDADKLFNLINTEREYVGEYLDWVENIKTLEDEQKYIENQIVKRQNLKAFDWCIFTNGSDDFLGYIGTDPVSEKLFKKGGSIDWENGTVSFAYFLKQSASGHGYMTEALNALKDISLDLGFNRIEISSEAANIKSQKVAERCGFVRDKQDPGKMYINNQA